MVVQIPEPSAADADLAQQIFQLWQQGSQAQALDLLSPNRRESMPAWADAFAAWLYMQQGIPGYESAVPRALRAVDHGMPWAAFHLFNNMVGNLSNQPQLLDSALKLAKASMPWAAGIDPVGQAWNLLSQGQSAAAVRLMGMRLPVPLLPDGWDGVVERSQGYLTTLENLVAAGQEDRASMERQTLEASESIERSSEEIRTSAAQANLLITTVLSDSATSLYKKAAERSEPESKSAWRWGLAALGSAAIVAVLPLLLHYATLGPSYSATNLVAVHVASTVALASFAGVLLARSRARDMATQRNYELETALGTMVAYSAQIFDPLEKQKFLMLMGQLVLQAHLTGGQGGASDDSLAGLLALANLVRPTSTAGAAPS